MLLTKPRALCCALSLLRIWLPAAADLDLENEEIAEIAEIAEIEATARANAAAARRATPPPPPSAVSDNFRGVKKKKGPGFVSATPCFSSGLFARRLLLIQAQW